MMCKSLVALILFVASAPALAAQQIAPVQVTGSPGFQASYSCENPVRPSRSDVQKILGLREAGQSHRLRRQLADVIDEACAQGAPSIAVQRDASHRGLVWAPVAEQQVQVASN